MDGLEPAMAADLGQALSGEFLPVWNVHRRTICTQGPHDCRRRFDQAGMALLKSVECRQGFMNGGDIQGDRDSVGRLACLIDKDLAAVENPTNTTIRSKN